MLFGCTRRKHISPNPTPWSARTFVLVIYLLSLAIYSSDCRKTSCFIGCYNVSKWVLSVKTLNLTAICRTKWILAVMMETMLCHPFNHNDEISRLAHGTTVWLPYAWHLQHTLRTKKICHLIGYATQSLSNHILVCVASRGSEDITNPLLSSRDSCQPTQSRSPTPKSI